MAIHHLLNMARKSGNPVIEDGQATFVWKGDSAPRLIDDFHNWEDSPQKMVRAGSGLWSFSISLPEDAYLEYAFIDSKTGERLPDPFNTRYSWNGFDANNNYFYMPKGKPSPLTIPKKKVPKGKITRHAVPTLDYAIGAKRTVHLYQPAVEAPVPLIFIYDGNDYLSRANLNIIVDNLIARNRIHPIAMAFIENREAARTVEYSCAEATIGLLMECVMPLAQKHLNLEPVKNGNYGIIGASLGGLMAVFTALRFPKIFQKVLSQSGAFNGLDSEAVVMDLVRYAPRPEIDIWMDVGKFEFLLDCNRQMYALLKEKKYRVKYREYPAGHNFTAWQNDIAHGLETLYRKEK